ncbi:MAG: Na/Pi cotransporter family protein [Alphaproteobacteria bacterium]|nr:Na/Pi cotransporter family protein [Alphaproteobacteria bacterium]
MTPTIVLIHIIAGVCLLLWGVMLLRSGVTKGFGALLRRVLSASTSNRYKSFLSGLVITTFLQSSMATTLIVSSFAGQGMITAGMGIAVVLGADVGTTLVAQALSLNMGLLSPILMIVGYVLYSFESNGKLKNLGRIAVGLSLMIMALALIREGAEPLKDSETLPLILAPLESDPFFAVLVAALLTWIAHSSLAIVLLLMSLVAGGALPMMLGLYMVLGANVGGTIAPLIATLRDNPNALRIPLGNMLIRVIGVCAAIPFLHYIHPLLFEIDPTPEREIVNFHTAFNLALAIVFLPFVNIISELLKRALPDRLQPEDPGKSKYLNDKDLDTPSVALSSAMRETLRMADLMEKMLQDTMTVFKTNDERLLDKIKEEDNTLDQIYGQIKNYMARLTQGSMDKKEAARYFQILMFSTNLEHAGDVIDKNLMPLAQKKIKNQFNFSPEGLKEIEHMHGLIVESVRLAQSVFVSQDVNMARKMLEDKDIIRKAETDGMSTHIERLRGGVPETIATSSLHLDIIRDYRRINTYMCTVAYPILEEKGQINPSRLRPQEIKMTLDDEVKL